MRRALGRGLSQIIADQAASPESEASIEDILPNPMQPRAHFDDATLQELAESIREHGILQPMLVRPLPNGKYELIAGERRWRAAKLVGVRTVPITVRAVDAEASLELAIIENIQREDINPVECARAYRRLMDTFALTQEGVAIKVGKSRTAVANTMRLLRLPTMVLDALEAGQITEGHARAVLAVANPERQSALYERIVSEGLSVRDAERLAQGRPLVDRPLPGRASGTEKAAVRPPSRDPNDVSLERGLSERLGLPVKLARKEFGGHLTIEFYSDEDLTKLVDSLGFEA